jgi:hypothetical protein
MGASSITVPTGNVRHEAHCFVFQGDKTLLRRDLVGQEARWTGFSVPLVPGRLMHHQTARGLISETGLIPARMDYHGQVKYVIGGATARVVQLFSARGNFAQPNRTQEVALEWFWKGGLPHEQMEREMAMWLAFAHRGEKINCSIGTELIQPQTGVMGSVKRAYIMAGVNENLERRAELSQAKSSTTENVSSGFSFRKIFRI